MRTVQAVVSALVLGLAACGSPATKAEGESCVASSECGPGLVCDLNRDPAVCAGNLTPRPDAGVPPDIDASLIDASLIDASLIDAPPGTPDAAPDANVDAAPDANVDAAPDAEIDAL